MIIKLDEQNYKYEDGKAVNINTGEVFDVVTVLGPKGTYHSTPAQKELYKEYLAQEQEKSLRKRTSNTLGSFYFLRNTVDFKGITESDITRLIFLSTYTKYGTSKLIYKNKPVYRKELIQLLGISKAETSKFLNRVCPKFLLETDEGIILSKTDIFIRGNLTKEQKADVFGYRKFYIKAVRKLYNEVDKTKHKHLGYIFRLLPYINIEFNVLCSNPQEEELEDVDFITLGDFCDLIGYNKHNVGRLISSFKQISFNIDGKNRNFVNFVISGMDILDSRVYINPRILYSGKHYERVEILGAL